MVAGRPRRVGFTAVTALVPTWVFGGQVAGLWPGARSHCGVACGLTLRPVGRSRLTVFRLPRGGVPGGSGLGDERGDAAGRVPGGLFEELVGSVDRALDGNVHRAGAGLPAVSRGLRIDRKSTRLNSSHTDISRI